MPKRFKLNNRDNKQIFKKGTKVHPKNSNTGVMRGGIRF